MHVGRKISRMRELLGVKQEALAAQLGISQQAVSKIEQSEKVDEERLEEVARALGMNSEAIRNFNEDAALNFINNFRDSSVNNGPLNNYNCTFNPLEKLVEAIEENKKLYEALLKSEREKVALLERMLENKQK